MTRAGHFRPEDLLAHSGWAHDLARRLVADDATADDLVQDTFAAALAHPPREAGPLRPWLARVLANAARMRARGEGRRLRRERGTARGEALPSAAELTQRTEAQRLLMDALLELDEAQREVVLLRYFEGLSSAAIARRQGVPSGTVRARLKRGLDALRVRLEQRFDGEPGRWQNALAPLVMPPTVAATRAGAAGLLAGVIWMKLALYAVSAVAALLLVGFALIATGAIDRPFGEAPLEDVRFVSLARPAPAAVEGDTVATTPEPATRGALPAAEPDEPRTQPVIATVRLRFVDAEHRPVPGVAVSLSPASDRARAASGPDGSAVIEFVPQGPDGWARLAFECPGFAGDSLDVHARAGETVDLGAVPLHAGGALAGRVVDEGGEPLADVEVRVPGREVSASAGGGLRMTRESELGAARTTTDTQGLFRLTGLLAGDVRVEVKSADDLYEGRSGRVQIRPGQESTGLVIVAARIPADRRIEGLVLDPSGEPVAWAPVNSRYRTLWSSGSQSVVSGRDGRFRLVLSKRVDVQLEVRDPAGRWNSIAREDVAAGTLDLVLRFEESRPLELVLVDRSGAPVTRASVAVGSADGQRSLQWESDAADELGHVRLLLPGEPFRLEILAEGHARAELGPLEPAAVQSAPLRVELEPLPGLTGRVTSGGLPAAGAALQVRALARERTLCDGVPVWVEPNVSASGTADADGRFELTLREPGRYVLRAELEAHAPAEHGPFDYDPARGLQGVALALDAGGALEGRVVRADGLVTSSIVLVSRGDAHALTQRTGPDGRYRFEHLMPGPWQVLRVEEELSFGSGSSSSGPGAPYRGIDSDCRVLAGETTRYDLVEGPIQVATTLRGRLSVTGAGAGPWSAELLPLDESPGSAARVTAGLDGEGRFTLEVPRAGRYRLVLTEDEDGGALRIMTELDLSPGERAWEAEVSLGTLVLEGLAPGPEEPPVAALWRGADGLWSLTLARGDDGGQARVHVPAGRLEVARPFPGATGDPREWPIIGEATVVPGGEARLRL